MSKFSSFTIDFHEHVTDSHISKCNPNLTYNYSADGKKIISVTVTAGTTNVCSVPIPVTVPATATGVAAVDALGSEPKIYWTSLTGSPVTLTLSAQISI